MFEKVTKLRTNLLGGRLLYLLGGVLKKMAGSARIFTRRAGKKTLVCSACRVARVARMRRAVRPSDPPSGEKILRARPLAR